MRLHGIKRKLKAAYPLFYRLYAASFVYGRRLLRLRMSFFMWLVAKCNPDVVSGRIFFLSHMGKQYSCNPLYISDCLIKMYGGSVCCVWGFTDAAYKKLSSAARKQGARSVRLGRLSGMKAMYTSCAIVTNVDVPSWYKKNPGQIVLNTWHGGGTFKTCGFANRQNFSSKSNLNRLERIYRKNDVYVSSSRFFSDEVIRRSRLHEGEILECGMPRNDALVKGEWPAAERNVRRVFSVPADKRIVLYAPTYRSRADSQDFERLNPQKLLRALEERFRSEFILLYRTHHFNSSLKTFGALLDKECLPATAYPDMQELLYASDVLVSDYSSCIWDFSLMYKPVFLFVPDASSYAVTRETYLPVSEWPYIQCGSNSELYEKIIGFDDASYRENVAAYFRRVGCCETGDATAETVRFLMQKTDS